MSSSRSSRRSFLAGSAGVALGLNGLRGARIAGRPTEPIEALGPLIADPLGVLDLPAGFEYRVISIAGETMDDGLFVPPRHDGMTALAGPGGRTVLIRNHENAAGKGGAFGAENELFERVPADRLYDAGGDGVACLGGTTTLIFDTGAQKLERHFLSLAGTLVNCAGGSTPWGSWVSCEETTVRAAAPLRRDHGYCFEVPADGEGLVVPKPLIGLGRFKHEAIAVDPLSGCVYLTEDVPDGLFYRFVPDAPGDLAAGGKLQALSVRGADSLDTRNWHALTHVASGDSLDVDWVDLDDVESPNDDLRARGFVDGAARFARGEGVHHAHGAVWFTCTIGGRAKLGQVWRYEPSPFEGTSKERSERGKLSLFLEPNDEELLRNCDNLCGTPFGHLVLCEDGKGSDRLIGATADGRTYEFGRNAKSSSELAGVTFSPDGTTLFVNLQEDGMTLAITGPWDRAAAI